MGVLAQMEQQKVVYLSCKVWTFLTKKLENLSDFQLILQNLIIFGNTYPHIPGVTLKSPPSQYKSLCFFVFLYDESSTIYSFESKFWKLAKCESKIKVSLYLRKRRKIHLFWFFDLRHMWTCFSKLVSRGLQIRFLESLVDLPAIELFSSSKRSTRGV